jgi:hypothetical protein
VHSPCNDGKMKLTIRTGKGAKIELEVDTALTVRCANSGMSPIQKDSHALPPCWGRNGISLQIGELKAKIQERDRKLVADYQVILHGGKNLRNDATIASTGITEAGYLFVMGDCGREVRSDGSRLRVGPFSCASSSRLD